jgi:hypothetical protein
MTDKNIHNFQHKTDDPYKKPTKISRLGGGDGGSQHEQYPGEHGYEDSGKQGEVETDTTANYSDRLHEPNRDGFRDKDPAGETDTEEETNVPKSER